jgi:uncharacterized C2H2 Zn-finger protein
MSEYNDNALKEYNDKALDKCPNCGRTFLPDRLVVHLRSCNKAHGKVDAVPDKGSPMRASGGGSIGGGSSGSKVSGMGSPSKEPAFVKRPKTIVCYIW